MFRKIYKFLDFKGPLLNFAKYIITHTFAKFKYFHIGIVCTIAFNQSGN